ncbi:MAG: response regulator, partial [Enterocloster sp.]
MLKLLIADDERIIRETISTIIDWKKYDIEVTGLCSNGIEAYDMILDESPDIVLTDIRMPGMSGLELIKKISQTDLHTQFIILSGYGEFEYAKEAMKYGVRHYILKPCNELQILDCVNQCKKDYSQLLTDRNMRKQQFQLQSGMLHNVISSILNDRLCQSCSLEEILPKYEQYIDFHFTSYRLFYIYFLEYESLPEFLELLKSYRDRYLPQVIIYGAYVNHTLLLFLQDIGSHLNGLEQFISRIRLSGQKIETEFESCSYSSLKELLAVVLEKLKRFSMIYYINDFHITFTCNYNTFISRIQALYEDIRGGDTEKLQQVAELLDGINNVEFLKQLAGSLFLKLTADLPSLSTFELAEWLLELDREADPVDLKNMIIQKLLTFLNTVQAEAPVSSMTQQIYNYVEENLQDSNLTLKYIAENHLFMNVDYVSKKFYKET